MKGGFLNFNTLIDPRFVRFRTRPVMSENLNAQLQKVKKLEHFKVTRPIPLFGWLGEKNVPT